MFKAAEIGVAMSDAQFRRLKDPLRLDLIQVQQQARDLAKFPIIIVLAGVKGAGVIDTLNLLNTWMDPRWIESRAFSAPTPEELERPPLWRYLQSLPAKGSIGLYLGGWYDDAIAARLKKGGRKSGKPFHHILDRISAFERSLTDSGALVLKFWLHADEAHHKAATDAHRIDPLFGFRTSDAALPALAPYKSYMKAAAAVLDATHTPAAPWHIVEGTDDNYRRASVLSLLREFLTAHLETWKKVKKNGDAPGATAPVLPALKRAPSLGKLRMPGCSSAAYNRAFAKHQHRVYVAQKAAQAAGISCVVAFEGWDAAGKGGAIRRLTYSLNAFNYHVVPIATPTDDEAAHHYLWRFWRHLPGAGRVTIFDRTWYGRVLVERVEKFCAKAAWKRSYGEINAFEDQLVENGTVLIKFWMQISKKEQKRRLKERQDTAYKQWMLTDDDWRAHKKYDDYLEAADEMIARTSTPRAPWHVIPADDKHYARLKVLETVAVALEKAVKQKR